MQFGLFRQPRYAKLYLFYHHIDIYLNFWKRVKDAGKFSLRLSVSIRMLLSSIKRGFSISIVVFFVRIRIPCVPVIPFAPHGIDIFNVVCPGIVLPLSKGFYQQKYTLKEVFQLPVYYRVEQVIGSQVPVEPCLYSPPSDNPVFKPQDIPPLQKRLALSVFSVLPALCYTMKTDKTLFVWNTLLFHPLSSLRTHAG